MMPNELGSESNANEKWEESSAIRRYLFRALSMDWNAFGYYFNSECNFTKIARIPQVDTWDCGVACLLMISRWLRDKKEIVDGKEIAKERAELLLEIDTRSIWTSDLMHRLQSWKTKNAHESAAFGFVLASRQLMDADVSYRTFGYYEQAFEEDQSRVARTFRDLRHRGVPMIQTTPRTFETEKRKMFWNRFAFAEKTTAKRDSGLSLQIVVELVRNENCLAIVLVDNSVLLENPILDPWGESTHEYAGHYVVLCGISEDKKHVELARNSASEMPIAFEKKNDTEHCFVLCNPDPSSPAFGGYMFVTPRKFESAWRAKGTDEDIIILRKENKQIPLCDGILRNIEPQIQGVHRHTDHALTMESSDNNDGMLDENNSSESEKEDRTTNGRRVNIYENNVGKNNNGDFCLFLRMKPRAVVRNMYFAALTGLFLALLTQHQSPSFLRE